MFTKILNITTFQIKLHFEQMVINYYQLSSQKKQLLAMT